MKSHVFVTFNKRTAAEDAIKNTFTNLVIKGKKLNIVWCKKVDEKLDTGDKVVLRVHDYKLLPCFDFNLKAQNAPRPPTKPPINDNDQKQQDLHLINVISDKKQSYSSMRADNFGGKKM